MKLAKDKKTIELEFKVTKDLISKISKGKEKFSGNANITISGVTDMAGNVGNLEVKEKVFIDTYEPTIKKLNIIGGGASAETTLSYIDSKAKDITLEIMASEELGKVPTVEIGNVKYKAVFDKKVKEKDKNLYVYKLTVSCSELVNKSVAKMNSVVPIKIKDYEDKTGNKGIERTFNSKTLSSNKKYLYFGSKEVGEVYLSAYRTKKSLQNPHDADVNKDGFITNYDSLLYLNHSLNVKVKGESSCQFKDINKDKKCNSADALEIQNIALKAENIIEKNEERVFKVYDKKQNILNGKNLKVYVYKNSVKDSNRIYTSDKDIKLERDDSATKITVKNAKNINKIILKAVYQKDGKGDKNIGELVLTVKK